MLVSVFLPTYNANELLLNATIKSVLNQTYKDIELWCVDDGSTDDTPIRLAKLAKEDSRLHVICKDHQGSVPFSWNTVIPKLNGEFILYLSHDDILSLDCIEKLVLRQQNENSDCVIPSCVGFQNNYTNPESENEDFNRRNNVEGRHIMSGKDAFLNMLNYDIPGFALWRTSIIKSCGMPTESFNSDECMQRIWALNCHRVSFESNAHFYYRLSSNSITRGLKPYHYGSLLTQKRLFCSIGKLGLRCYLCSQARKFLIYYLKSYVYLKREYKRHSFAFDKEDETFIIKCLNSFPADFL